jgi:hypothetical protein
VEQHDAEHLHRMLGQARLPEYEAFCAGDKVAALRLFCWNTEVSAAFYGPLQHLELALRSVLDQHLFQLFGQDDWWNHSQANLHHGARAKIDEAVRQLSRRGPVPAPAHVVAELPFGFWVSLLGSGNSYDQRLWRTALYRAFPGYHGGRHALHRRTTRTRRVPETHARPPEPAWLRPFPAHPLPRGRPPRPPARRRASRSCARSPRNGWAWRR